MKNINLMDAVMKKADKVDILILAAFGSDEKHIKHIQEIFKNISIKIKKSKRMSFQIVNVRVAILKPGQKLPDSIISKIYFADIVIADLTDVKTNKRINVNVAYEYGIASGMISLAKIILKSDKSGINDIKTQSQKQLFAIVNKKSKIDIDKQFSDIKGIIYGEYEKSVLDNKTEKVIISSINKLYKMKNSD